ncbi:MAG: KTSC domain-containing protein [Desulfobulbaceae bacterium]
MSEWISTPQSSNIAGFCYEEGSQTLTVEFNSGSRYDYYDVPKHIYEGIKAADSKGKYLNVEIKGSYRYARQ